MEVKIPSQPLFSVILCTYQREELLGRALRSVLAQTFSGFEVLVIDDCSPDSAEELVNSFGDPRIRFFRSPQNAGVSVCTNIGLKNARGEFVCFLGDDDEFSPTFLQEMQRHFATVGPQMSYAWCGIEEYLEGSNKSCATLVKVPSEAKVSAYRRQILSLGTGYGLMLRRSCWLLTGEFDESLRYAVDFEYLIRLLQADLKGASLDRHLVRVYRQSLRLTKSSLARCQSLESILTKHKAYLISIGLYHRYQMDVAKDYAALGHHRQKRKMLLESLRHAPAELKPEAAVCAISSELSRCVLGKAALAVYRMLRRTYHRMG